jgi:5,10-methylenetetrahydromethanopterin reductase
MKTQFGLGLQSDKPPGEYARLARLAEVYGFDVISVFSDLLFQPPIVALLEIARATSSIRLGAACWNPYTLHPYEIAGQLAALDNASAGRAYLGLARGTWLGEIAVAQPRPVAHLRQAVTLIRALLAGDDRGVDGDIFPLAGGSTLRYELSGRIPPLLIGTWGAHTAALAGELAAEVKVGGSANPLMVKVIQDRIAVGARRAGRDLTDIAVVFGAVTVVDADGAAARAMARCEVAMYLAVVAELDPTLTLPSALVSDVKALVSKGNHAAAGSLISDEVLDLFAFSGTPEQVAAQVLRLIDAGASRIEFGTPHGLSSERGIELLGSRVLPLVDAGSAIK